MSCQHLSARHWCPICDAVELPERIYSEAEENVIQRRLQQDDAAQVVSEAVGDYMSDLDMGLLIEAAIDRDEAHAGKVIVRVIREYALKCGDDVDEEAARIANTEYESAQDAMYEAERDRRMEE